MKSLNILKKIGLFAVCCCLTLCCTFVSSASAPSEIDSTYSKYYIANLETDIGTYVIVGAPSSSDWDGSYKFSSGTLVLTDSWSSGATAYVLDSDGDVIFYASGTYSNIKLTGYSYSATTLTGGDLTLLSNSPVSYSVLEAWYDATFVEEEPAPTPTVYYYYGWSSGNIRYGASCEYPVNSSDNLHGLMTVYNSNDIDNPSEYQDGLIDLSELEYEEYDTLNEMLDFVENGNEEEEPSVSSGDVTYDVDLSSVESELHSIRVLLYVCMTVVAIRICCSAFDRLGGVER